MKIDIKNNKLISKDNDGKISFYHKKRHILTVSHPDNTKDFIGYCGIGAKSAVEDKPDGIYYLYMALHSLMFEEYPDMIDEVIEECKSVLPCYKKRLLGNIVATMPLVAKTLQVM